MKTKSLALILCLSALLLTGTVVQAYTITPETVLSHIEVLAHDSLEGRQVGEKGEWKAAQYIASVFTAIGLEPKGDEGTYFQAFSFIKAIDLTEKNSLSINGETLQLKEEFLPMKQSASTEFTFDKVIDVNYGIKTKEEDGHYNDYENKDVSGQAVLIKRLSPSADDNPHVDFSKYESLTSKINSALQQGATAVFFYSPESEDDTLMDISPMNITPKDIPIIFLGRKGIERLGLSLDRPELTNVVGQTELVKTRDTAYNVVGYLPTGNDTTVILGAHYDHLGWGTSASLYTGTKPMIHNGADDNASGVAATLELAKYYADKKADMNYSMLFIAFTGEEAGLLGSNWYSKHMTIDSTKARMMVNMDMIGRLKDQHEGLAVFGTGTCTEFKEYFDTLKYDDLKVVFREPGTGPSDHTSFYNRGIPSLHLFTGAHSDYHKPSDDIEFIDADGIVKVTKLVSHIVDHFDAEGGTLTFQKTADPSAGKRRSHFSVTLGVMPDYIAEVVGLKIDGVTPDRPAARAGIIEGDIVIKMGDIEIGDINDYMVALGSFRKGDTTMVVVKRGEENVELQVIFK